MKSKFKSILLENDIDVIKSTVEKLINIFFQHALDNNRYPLRDYKNIKLIDEEFSRVGINNIDKFLNLINSEIFDQAIYKCKPEYLKFVDNGTSIVNIVATVINSLLNQNLTAHLTDSPGATFNEIALIKCIRKLAGFPVKREIKSILDVGGYFVSGGMMGNMAALLVARNILYHDAQTSGISKNVKLIIPSFASHYSTWNSMGWLGFGESNVVHVKTNNFSYNLNELDKSLKKIKESGSFVLAVVASIGDPYSMTIENIKEVRKICNKYKTWLHGDGANCGILIFSDRYKKYIKDINLCDSITLDPHKLLGLNYPSSLFLCKDIDKFNSVVSYWNMINRKNSFDLGIITPFLNSRGFDSLKLWILLKYFGLCGVAKIIDNKIDTTKRIYKILSRLGNNIKFWNNRITFSLLFQIVPDSLKLYINNPDKIFFERISDAQQEFKRFLEKESFVEIYSFNLPASIAFEDDNNNFVTVLCIHNGHEKVPNVIINQLKRNILKYCKNN